MSRRRCRSCWPIYSFTLPACAVNRGVRKQSWVDTLGLRAFALFKEKRMAVFFIFSMLLGAALQITNAFGDSYIRISERCPSMPIRPS